MAGEAVETSLRIRKLLLEALLRGEGDRAFLGTRRDFFWGEEEERCTCMVREL